MKEAITIQRAASGDLEALTALDPLSSSEPLRKANLRGAITEGLCLAAFRGERPLGFGYLSYHFFGYAFIELLYVDTGERQQGIGAGLIEALVQLSSTRKIFTSTNETNIAMQALLAKAGFLTCGRIEGLDEGDPELFYRRTKPL